MALYEKFWDCPACGTKGISALRKLKCPNCGHTKSPQDGEHRSNVEITDPDGIELARGGPHWTCSSCGSVNLKKYSSCRQCGDPREQSDVANRVIELGSTPPPAYNPHSDTPHEEYGVADSQRVNDEPETVEPQPSYGSRFIGGDSTSIRSSPVPWRGIAIGVVVAIVLLGVGWSMFATSGVEARVTGFSWTRDVTIERYQTFHESGQSRPMGAYNVRYEERLVGYEDITETRTRTVTHEKTCYRDLGNGAEESYDCSYDETESYEEKVGERAIYEDWYEYDVNRWEFTRTEHAEGTGREPYWPQFNLTLNGQQTVGTERVTSRQETYTVQFQTVNTDSPKEYKLNTDQSDWFAYEMEGTYGLEINAVGLIMNNPLRDE